jgi:hypothetical protein
VNDSKSLFLPLQKTAPEDNARTSMTQRVMAAFECTRLTYGL